MDIEYLFYLYVCMLIHHSILKQFFSYTSPKWCILIEQHSVLLQIIVAKTVAKHQKQEDSDIELWVRM